ncbi:hypothetical protein [Rhodoplanes elegans]|uniref:hypothetical protein n=1 Tax=Rhodoplanes elegans TaxID=29408 RepID=UPI0019127A1A|nr:hypothetical protein [Rhodoplanes elegans]
MPPTPETTAAGYRALWTKAAIVPARRDDAAAVAARIRAAQDRYLPVARATGVPWWMIGALHMRESSLSFAGHLHNGDSLNGYTRQVPKGRPKVGHGPPFGWTESAIDALTMKGLQTVTVWSLERVLYECERYNGWGYLGKGNSPYLWSWTTLYAGGKYVRDHVYDPNAVDRQPGVVAIFKALAAAGVVITSGPSQPAPPKDVTDRATRRSRAVRNAGGGLAAGGGAGETATQTGTVRPADAGPAFLHPVLTWSLIGVGLAVVVVAAAMIVRRTALIERAWTGDVASRLGRAVLTLTREV